MATVYPPAEDSWLLESCILKEKLKGKKCLDLGCGSGVQSAAMISSGATDITAVDVDEDALKATKEKIQKLGHILTCTQSDLFSKVKEKFDFIAFNPPYVPSDEVKWKDLDGGERGRETIDRFLEQFPSHLNKGGVLLLLISSLNDEKEICAILKKKKFSVSAIAEKKLFFEKLIVLKVVREN